MDMKINCFKYILFVLLLAAGINYRIKAEVTDPDTLMPEFHAVRIETALNLSGKLDDPAWLKGIPVTLKYGYQYFVKLQYLFSR